MEQLPKEPSSKSIPSPARPRLGRGLNALFSVQRSPSDAVVPDVSKVYDPTPISQTPIDIPGIDLATIPIQQIDVNPRQPRRVFDDVALQELAASLKTNGLIQPIIVRQVGERFELIAGERRLRAAKIAEMGSIPAVVRVVDRPTQAQWALVENIQREALNPIDRAMAYRDLIAQLGLTQSELANRLGEQRSSIANYLRLLELEPSVRQFVAAGQLSLGHAKVLAGVSDAARQASLAEQCVKSVLTVRELERLVIARPDAAASPAGKSAMSAHLADLDNRLTQHVGLRVNVQKSATKGKGKVVIHYSTLNQFDDLLKKLGYTADENE